jgi:Ca2+-binding RTX toxin-like protein
MSRRIVLSVLGAVATIGLAAPAGALADTVVTNGTGGQIIVTSDSQDAENLVISRPSTSLECNPQPAPCLQLANAPQSIIDGASGCDQLIFNMIPLGTVVVCSPGSITSILLDLNDADDLASVSDSVPPTTMNGGAGDDSLNSASGSDALLGGPDDDRLEGGGGFDTFIGGAGADAIFARDGLQELVDCGSEADSVDADTIDVLTDCENVPPSGPTAVTPGPTGQRAAALKKCKKKHSHEKRKKCRKKANLLPL